MKWLPIQSDACDMYVDSDCDHFSIKTNEDAFDGEVSALAMLTKEDAKKLRDYLDAFINS